MNYQKSFMFQIIIVINVQLILPLALFHLEKIWNPIKTIKEHTE